VTPRNKTSTTTCNASKGTHYRETIYIS